MRTTYKKTEIQQYQKNLLEYIKILFFGAEWDEIEICSFEDNQVLKSFVPNPEKVKIDLKKNRKSKIVVIMIETDYCDKDKVFHLIKSFQNDNIISYYLYLKGYYQVRFVIEIMNELAFGEIKLYGITNHFHSIVPMTGHNHKLVEKYVLGLKTYHSMMDKINYFIKKFLICISSSKTIYKGFIIISKDK